MNDNENISLGQLATFRNGVNFDSGRFGSGLKVINVSDFKDYLTPQIQNLNEIDGGSKWPSECYLQKDDIIFVRSNGNKDLIGRSMIIKKIQEKVTYSAFCIRLRFLLKKEVDPLFYLYFFKSSGFRKRLSSYGNGTNISNLNQKILNNLEVPSPPLKTQQKIASILSAYDELIENNSQRIKLLEQMAEEIYKEWFVRLRFPGYKETKIVDGVPEGWCKTKLGKVIELAYGKSLPDRERIPGEVPVYGSGGIGGYHNKGLVAGPGIVIGRKGTVGSLYYVYEDFFPIDTVFYAKTELPLEYVYQNFKYQNFISGDSAVPGLSRDQVYRNSFLVPDEHIVSKYIRIARPIFEQVNVLNEKNELLQKTRDLLLPRLISGKLSVAYLPEQEPELMMAAEPEPEYHSSTAP
ncbi:MAG: hypothetical protein HEP71_25275 [Roseivirga sp.]|nr:hypothetical protein [Roseivirga sp.]